MTADVEVIVERVQESFGVLFRPGELADDSCFADLCASVISHLAHTRSDKCFTSIVFWRLRRGCVDLFGASRSDVTPLAPTDLILPRFGRRSAWHRLAAATGLRLPRLEYSSVLAHIIFFGAALVPIGLLARFGASWATGLASLVLWPLTSNLLFSLLRPFANRLSSRSMTIGDLARVVVGLNYGSLAQEFGGISREKELLEAIRNVIADLIDIDPEILATENPRLIELADANDGFRAEV